MYKSGKIHYAAVDDMTGKIHYIKVDYITRQNSLETS